jgi:eukaryotic-like serine/threonine-protein kinase
MIPEAGQRFGPYEILGKLGGGGMGLVFRAWDERLHREVAVKLLQKNYKMPGMRERFLQEARAASGLNHPNICTIFDIGEQDGDPYLVMELLEGETLKDRIARGALLADEIVRYAVEIADALTVAHAKGIVHRDIKPANIFLVKMPNGKFQAKVLDFGLAKIALEVRGGWESRTLDLTLAGATVGTVAYMSPEQARGEPLDMRSDFFSLGVMMYEMATRRVPFEGTTSALTFAQIFNQVPDPVRDWNESIPRELERLILKLMTKDRKARFQTASELHEALAKIADNIRRGSWLRKGAASVVPLVRAADPVARHKGRRRRPRAQGELLPAVVPSASSSDNGMNRPAHGMERDRAGVESQSSAPLTVGAVAVESGESQTHVLRSAVTRNHPSIDIDTTTSESDALAANKPLPNSWSLISQTEHGVRGVDPQTASAWTLMESTEFVELVEGQAGRARVRMRLALAAAAVLIVAAGLFLLARSGLFRPIVLGSSDRLLLTVIQNKTTDKTLDGTVMQGLEIALRQSKSLDLLGGEAYRAGLRQIEAENGSPMTTVTGQRVAQKVNARAYLYGEVTGSQAPYTISVEVLEADSNDKVASLEEVAATSEEIPAAIGRLAKAVRAEVSEDSKADLRKSVPLEREASAKVDALHAYALGEAAMETGHRRDALIAYKQATRLDPGFAQAYLRLAWLYRDEKAEVASADAATAAREASAHASDKVKLLAKFCYEMNASGDTNQAAKTIHNYMTRYPLDVDGMRGMALVLGMQGHLLEALKMAQQGYTRDPFDAQIYAEAELAMIGMGRYDDVLQLETEAKRVGLAGSANVLTAGYLGGRLNLVDAQFDAMQSALAGGSPADMVQITYAEWYSYGLYLDNTGRLGEGSKLWKTAATASAEQDLSGTQSYMLAQGALDRALAESCTAALQMADEVRNLPKGVIASFNAGMAAALCGDEPYAERTIVALQQGFPHGTAVTQYYVPELHAAAEIGVNEPTKSIQTLTDLSKYDEISLTPYLRGMAHAAVGQQQSAIYDFQIVLARHGGTLALQGNVYPMAELGEARASVANRDKPESVEAYRQFLTLWSNSDEKQPLINEALTRSK